MPMSSFHCFGIDMEKQSEAPHVKQIIHIPIPSLLPANRQHSRMFPGFRGQLKAPSPLVKPQCLMLQSPIFQSSSQFLLLLPLCFMVNVVNPTNTIDEWYKPSTKKDVCINYWVSNPICSMEHLHFSTPQK